MYRLVHCGKTCGLCGVAKGEPNAKELAECRSVSRFAFRAGSVSTTDGGAFVIHKAEARADTNAGALQPEPRNQMKASEIKAAQ